VAQALTVTPAALKHAAWSFSKMETGESCPAQFKHKHVLRTAAGPSAPETVVGTAALGVLEHRVKGASAYDAKKIALANTPLTVHGDGQQSRCFAHVADVVEALARTLETEACFGEVINIGSDTEVTVADLARTIVALTGSKSEVRFIPYEQVYGADFEDMRRRIPSLEKARKLLKYEPKRDLKTIILDVAE